MAGSLQSYANPKFKDEVLSARLEALRQLADRVSERVMVVDRNHTIIYANQSAWEGQEGALGNTHPTKCYEALIRRTDPCAACPATEVFESGEVRAVSCSIEGDRIDCGMQQAFPLMSDPRKEESLLVLFGSEKALKGEGPGRASKVPFSDSAPHQGIRFGDLIGQSPAMRELFEMIRLVADSQASVLIQGESGTGKELVARTIHRFSYRRSRPFVVVDCSSLPETLLESELFGHVKGAFTGAVHSKKGLFEEADGGTIFLDEIVDTSPNFQSKLLRVLQEGEVKPVGSSRSIKVNVRVISATNRDLQDQVEAKVFREDLYYRLSVLPLYLPPLRDRREDVHLLVWHFVEVSCRRHRKPMRTLTPGAMQALKEWAWPGNIRELQHLIERVVVTTSGPEIGSENLFDPPKTPPSSDLRTVTREATKQAEEVRIVEALRQASGNRAKAAQILKISRASLYNKLRAYGIR